MLYGIHTHCYTDEGHTSMGTHLDVTIDVEIIVGVVQGNYMYMYHAKHAAVFIHYLLIITHSQMGISYILMPKSTPYILVNREAMPPLCYCVHTFFHALRYTFALYPRYTIRNSCYTSFTHTLVMTLYLCYTASHSMPPALCNCILPVVYGTHQ